MIHHIHVYKIEKLYRLEIDAKDEEKGKLIALSLIQGNENKIKPEEEPDMKFLALGSKEAWGDTIGQHRLEYIKERFMNKIDLKCCGNCSKSFFDAKGIFRCGDEYPEKDYIRSSHTSCDNWNYDELNKQRRDLNFGDIILKEKQWHSNIK